VHALGADTAETCFKHLETLRKRRNDVHKSNYGLGSATTVKESKTLFEDLVEVGEFEEGLDLWDCEH